jgi:hypothetical protein
MNSQARVLERCMDGMYNFDEHQDQDRFLDKET